LPTCGAAFEQGCFDLLLPQVRFHRTYDVLFPPEDVLSRLVPQGRDIAEVHLQSFVFAEPFGCFTALVDTEILSCGRLQRTTPPAAGAPPFYCGT
jgi:hypothetical protein